MSDDKIKAHIINLVGPILVLGASGFIGANLFHRIAKYRNDVFAVVNNKNAWRLADLSEEQIIECDLRDPAAAKNLVDSISPKTLFNLVAYGAYSFEEDVSNIYATNFQCLVNLVSLLEPKNITAFINAGSSSEYGNNSAAPKEGDLCLPNSHYAVSKFCAANYLSYLGKSNNFPCVHLRLYSIYGALEDTSRLIPNLVRSAINMTFPPFVNPDTSRDFVYVDDACNAFIISAAMMGPNLYGEIFNIGSGLKTTIYDLAYLIKEKFEIKEQPKFGEMMGRRWDIPDWYSNSEKVLSKLGWECKINLKEGLELTKAWIQSLSDQDFIDLTKKSRVNQHLSISAIVACYKDEQAIPLMHSRLTNTFRKIGVDYEIIFINDCSPDKSAEVIQSISSLDPRVLGVSHSRNFGSQMAFRSGMELATKNSVVLLDGDLQDPPELIEKFHQKWCEGYDVVFGRRVKRDMSWYWGLAYKAFYRLFDKFSYLTIPHDAGDFSLIDRRVVGWLLQCGERDVFMRGLRAYVGFRQTGVDYVRPERLFGKSTNNLLKNIEWAKKGIFSFSDTPLNLLTAIGILALIASFLIAAIVGVLKIFYPEIAPKGATTILIAILIFGSFNIFAIGLVGEYVAKIMSEVKARPRLIRSALIRNGEISELLPDGKFKKI